LGLIRLFQIKNRPVFIPGPDQVVPAGSLKPGPSPFQTCDGPFPFRAKQEVKRPGLNHFHSGPHLTERPFLVQPGFKLGHADLGGSDRDPGRSGRKRTRP
jgi:hypothetical protein